MTGIALPLPPVRDSAGMEAVKGSIKGMMGIEKSEGGNSLPYAPVIACGCSNLTEC